MQLNNTTPFTQLLFGDNRVELKNIADNTIDSIITDPPYELGFMGKAWDNTGIAYSVELWRECFRVLKPGGYLLSFGGTRTYHRMACAIEDAGFEIRDMIEWVYGSGFPKSLNIGKAVDKLQGNEREVVGVQLAGTGPLKNGHAQRGGGGGFICEERSPELKLTIGTSPYEGYGTALKPAHEPICMARKPIEGTVAENCLKWGTGGIDIDGSRVDFVSEADKKESTTKNQHADFGTKPMTNNNVYGDYSMIEPKNYNSNGRFPSNLIHDNSEEVRECFPETKSGKVTSEKLAYGNNSMFLNGVSNGNNQHGDSGNASRFFKSIIYQPKADKTDRGKGNTHPTVKPVELMEYLINMVTPKQGTVLDPFMGSGSTGVAAKKLLRSFIGIEMEQKSFNTAQKRISRQTVQLEMF